MQLDCIFYKVINTTCSTSTTRITATIDMSIFYFFNNIICFTVLSNKEIYYLLV